MDNQGSSLNPVRNVDLHDPGELAYWLKVLGTTHAELLAAIAAVGPAADAVSACLRRGSSAEASGGWSPPRWRLRSAHIWNHPNFSPFGS
jgi:hypothetical protein